MKGNLKFDSAGLYTNASDGDNAKYRAQSQDPPGINANPLAQPRRRSAIKQAHRFILPENKNATRRWRFYLLVKNHQGCAGVASGKFTLIFAC